MNTLDVMWCTYIAFQLSWDTYAKLTYTHRNIHTRVYMRMYERVSLEPGYTLIQCKQSIVWSSNPVDIYNHAYVSAVYNAVDVNGTG